MTTADTERPHRTRKTCREYEYSGKGEREARGHDPPPQRGSYRALDALGLRRGVGVRQSGKIDGEGFCFYGVHTPVLRVMIWHRCLSLL